MKIIIDGTELEAVPGETVLQAANRAGISIPTLCYHKAFQGQGRCRMCMVEVTRNGVKRTVASCTYPVAEGIEVLTSTPAIKELRKNIVMLLYKRAPNSPLMKELYQQYGCQDNSLTEDPKEKCILCGLCVKACHEMGNGAISFIMRGTEKRVATPYDEGAPECIGCGACARVCPTGAIEMMEEGNKRTLWHQDFELVACDRCGTPFATRQELERSALYREKGAPQLCDSCRKKQVAEMIQEYRN